MNDWSSLLFEADYGGSLGGVSTAVFVMLVAFVVGQRIIACFGMIGVFAFDMSGKPLWNKDLGAFPMQFGWGTGSSPALHDGRVFFQCDNEKSSFLVALDAKTGDEIWRVPRDEKSNWCTPYLWHNAKRIELVCAGL